MMLRSNIYKTQYLVVTQDVCKASFAHFSTGNGLWAGGSYREIWRRKISGYDSKQRRLGCGSGIEIRRGPAFASGDS
jgi:hypothetical protein